MGQNDKQPPDLAQSVRQFVEHLEILLPIMAEIIELMPKTADGSIDYKQVMIEAGLEYRIDMKEQAEARLHRTQLINVAKNIHQQTASLYENIRKIECEPAARRVQHRAQEHQRGRKD